MLKYFFLVNSLFQKNQLQIILSIRSDFWLLLSCPAKSCLAHFCASIFFLLVPFFCITASSFVDKAIYSTLPFIFLFF